MALSIFIISCETIEKPNETFTINGEFRGVSEGQVFLKVRGESGWDNIDSATIVDGKFTMKGETNEVEMVYLVTNAFRGGIPIFLENTDISVSLHKDSIQDVVISGSTIQSIYDQAKTEMEAFDQIWQDYYYNTYRFMTDDEKAQNEAYLNTIYDSAQIVKKDFIQSYVSEHNSNIASAQILIDQEDALGSDLTIELYNGLSADVKSSKMGKLLSDRVDIIKKTSIGQPLIDFVMNDTTGSPVKLSEATKGKYVLVDFWAAWCGPCRRENPNVVENYKKYNADGFEVFGVSFDEKKDNWLKAIAEDQLTWTQVSDLKGWNNAAGKLYGIRSIPQNILLDPDGIIIEKNLRGEALGEKLKEIFGK
jgi:peroxiredoxin